MKAIDMIKLPAVKIEETVDKVLLKKGGDAESDRLRKDLEVISRTAAMYAMYMVARQAGQRHAEAVRAAQGAAEMVWCAVLGYNGYHKFTF